ncbi:hypothetical protein KA005_43825, partial [bacterium]|nr:hypothetical protein [bacterium]
KVLRKYGDGPDEDGYRGHHLEIVVHVFYENETIRDICEVQIRTLAGDLWAVLSHRDFYKVPTQPPLSVRNDMLTLSKQLGVVDDLAVSLRQRIKDEISKEARQKAKKREPEKDMLTPENVIDLVDKTLKEKISVDFAYELIQYALVSDIVSLRVYKTLITSSKYRTIIENTFAKFGVKPLIEDYLIAPIILASEGIRAGRDIMRDIAKRYREEDITSPEKGVEISREQLEKEVKISGPEERKKKN